MEKLRILRDHWNGAPLPDLGRDRHGGDWHTTWRNLVRTDGVAGFTGLLAARIADPKTEFDRDVAEIGLTAARQFVIAKVERSAPPSIPPSLIPGIMELFENAASAALQWTMDDGEVPTLDLVRGGAGAFPTEFLRPNTRALCLFCCLFFGKADVIRVHDAGASRATLVDIDGPRLAEMRLLYPASWAYVTADYADFLRDAVGRGERYDVVTADTWHHFGRAIAWGHLSDIIGMCDGIFIVNYFSDMFEELNCAPDDLAALSAAVSSRTGVAVQFLHTMRRTDAVYWAVMRAAR